MKGRDREKNLDDTCKHCANTKGSICGKTQKPCPYPSDLSSDFVRMEEERRKVTEK